MFCKSSQSTHTFILSSVPTSLGTGLYFTLICLSPHFPVSEYWNVDFKTLCLNATPIQRGILCVFAGGGD